MQSFWENRLKFSKNKNRIQHIRKSNYKECRMRSMKDKRSLQIKINRTWAATSRIWIVIQAKKFWCIKKNGQSNSKNIWIKIINSKKLTQTIKYKAIMGCLWKMKWTLEAKPHQNRVVWRAESPVHKSFSIKLMNLKSKSFFYRNQH